jgi:hypothetical protein
MLEIIITLVRSERTKPISAGNKMNKDLVASEAKSTAL